MLSPPGELQGGASVTSQSRWSRDTRVQALLLVACALLPYLGTWTHDFVELDDPLAIVQFEPIRQLSAASVLALFRPEIYPGLAEYMPLKNVSYALDYALFGSWAPGYRIQQQLWYALGVVLLWAWLRRVLRTLASQDRLSLPAAWSDRLAWLTCALFALHPVHVESVTWLSGRKDVLCGAFMAWALTSALRYEGASTRRALWTCAFATALALLSKPMAIVLPLLVLVTDCVTTPESARAQTLRAKWPLYATVTAMCAGFALFYVRLAGALSGQSLEDWRNYAGPAYARWGQQLYEFAALAVAPLRLAPVLPPDLLDPAVSSPRALVGYATLILVLAGGGAMIWRRHVLGLAAGAFAIPLAPILLSPAWGQYVAARYAHLAVLGPLLALTWLVLWLLARQPRLQRVLSLAGLVFALTLGGLTVDYNTRWRDGLTLWVRSIDVYPRFTLYYEHAARLAFETGRTELGVTISERCLQLAPTDAGCVATYAGLLLRQDPPRAERMLRSALAHDPTGAVHLQLARLMTRTGRGAEGVELYLGWLRNKSVGVTEIEPLAWLAIDAGDVEHALFAARHTVTAGAALEPAGAPPRALLEKLASMPGLAPAEAQALRRGLEQCQRNDCLRQALRW